MISLLAVMLFELSPTLCNELRTELVEYARESGSFAMEDIDRIVGDCEVTWGPGGTASELRTEDNSKD